MSELSRAVARMFCVGFDGLTPAAHLPALFARGVQGVILFKRNVESARQFHALTRDLKRRSPAPLLVSVDQEGGRVRRLRDGFSEVPSMRAVGATGDLALAEAIGGVLGRELRAVNVDLDFAPVLDVDTNPKNPVIADRSFGATPELVSRLGAALLRGLQGAGVAACGKHFPGHGDTSQDSHVELPRLPHSLERLEAVELPPFRAAIEAGVASIMTAHVIFEPLDARFPATMSRPPLDGILRDRFGFHGVVISDDLEMKAIAEHFGLEEAVVRGTNAGVDLFLVCHREDRQHAAIDALVRAVERGEVPRARIDEANRRLDELFARWVRPPTDELAPGLLASEESRAVLARLEAAPTGRDPTEVAHA